MNDGELAYWVMRHVAHSMKLSLFISWFCPEELWVGGSVALPVVVDEAYRNQSDVSFRIVIAIDTFRIEAAYFLADKVVEVFRHILVQIVIFGLLVLMIPVGRLAEH